jgi:carbamoyl-phosphate synthase large subunit
LIESGKVDYILSTSSKGRLPSRDSVKIRRKAIERAIPCITSVDTATRWRTACGAATPSFLRSLWNQHRMRTEKMRVPFTKMNGTSNDYLYFNCFDDSIEAPESLSVYLSDLHGGVGGDGIILMERSGIADAKMRIFNRDGSEGKMCGNGIRCVGKYLYDNGMTDKTELAIETLSGVKRLRLYVRGGKVKSVSVDMGKAELEPEKVPVRLGGVAWYASGRSRGGPTHHLRFHGNPHCVVFVENPDLVMLKKRFSLEPASILPDRAKSNSSVYCRSYVKMRVWERGSGRKLACAGAWRAVDAATENGFCKRARYHRASARAGTCWWLHDETVTMTGDARKNFEGVAEL